METESPTEPKRSRKSVLLLGIAVVALAGVLFSFASMKSSAGTDQAALPQVVQDNPIGVALYNSMEKAETAKTVQVAIKNYAYDPAALTVAVGDTVTWTNDDTAPHTVTVSDGPVKFNSPNLQQGQTFTYTFTQAGTYSYYCAVHPDMKATVTVTDSGSGSTQPTTSTPTGSSAPTTSMSMPSSSSSESSSMSMPSSSTGGTTECIPTSVLQPIFDHVKSAHLETSPGQQVSDILNLDQYIKTHTVWLEQVLAPVLDGSADKLVTDTLTPILDHIKSAHLETSLGQQVTDALNLDQYIKTHTVWLEQVLTPLMNQATC
ncbi:cupredoxin family copper-binding protein [Amycolatopsis sp.]|uniref:cupredoxin domain-containing protein n=1 Tax=Amycolatopsis sp. TaxID=37632 RepID=UPI002BA72D32|nr:cupredoxin family copper-binding protein [Amycolatopsis sp.]HVV13580.1 cupredoxin family copper-binding protein [Amycolatopsis sp.]